MAKAAQSSELSAAFEKHEGETEEQVERLEQVFELLGEPARGKTCPAIIGIIEEGQEIIKEYKGTPALDAGLLSAAQAVEHYEISRYGTLKTWAGELGLDEAVQLLEETLEKATDRREGSSSSWHVDLTDHGQVLRHAPARLDRGFIDAGDSMMELATTRKEAADQMHRQRALPVFAHVLPSYETDQAPRRHAVSIGSQDWLRPEGARSTEATGTPWFWAINGAAGVLAASVAVAVNITFSINVSIWLGAACYVLIGMVAVALMSPSPRTRQTIPRAASTGAKAGQRWREDGRK
jgi:ferritin-like metal-binding protein YciE